MKSPAEPHESESSPLDTLMLIVQNTALPDWTRVQALMVILQMIAPRPQ